MYWQSFFRLVTKTISEAVLEHIFQVPETEVRSIFDNWGDCDGESMSGTPVPPSRAQHNGGIVPNNAVNRPSTGKEP